LTGLTKDYQIDICSLSTKHTELWSQDWLAWNQDNVSWLEQHVYSAIVISAS